MSGASPQGLVDAFKTWLGFHPLLGFFRDLAWALKALEDRWGLVEVLQVSQSLSMLVWAFEGLPQVFKAWLKSTTPPGSLQIANTIRIKKKRITSKLKSAKHHRKAKESKTPIFQKPYQLLRHVAQYFRFVFCCVFGVSCFWWPIRPTRLGSGCQGTSEIVEACEASQTPRGLQGLVEAAKASREGLVEVSKAFRTLSRLVWGVNLPP